MLSPFISGSQITCRFQNGQTLFKNLSFSFRKETYGLTGPNGAGKTTMLKLFTGEIQPTEGTLSIRGKTGVLPQILLSDQTIAEALGVKGILDALFQIEKGNASLELIEQVSDQWDIQDRIQKTLELLGLKSLDLNRPLKSLSGGEAVKIHLAKLYLSAPDILLLDEPTNNLDQTGRQALYELIQNWKNCLIVVSHDRELLAYVRNTVELTQQGLRFYGGNYQFYQEEREKETLALEQKITNSKQNERRQKLDLQASLERQQRRASRGQKKAEAGGIPKIITGGLKRKSQNTLANIKDTQLDRLAQARLETQNLRSQLREKNEIQIDLPETAVHSGKIILKIDRFNFRYEHSPHFLYQKPISFDLVGPKRVGILGPNGAGKSTLLRILLDPLSVQGETLGTVQLVSNRFAYLDQKTEILGSGSQTLLELFSQKTPHLTQAEQRIRLGRFQFHQEAALKKISQLSGGERMRAALACILFSESPPELLILDEPTNNLDIDSIENVESALSQFQGAMLVISHDLQFLEKTGISEWIYL